MNKSMILFSVCIAAAVKEGGSGGGKTYEASHDYSPISPYVDVPLVKDFTTLGV
jgi:hypothetical protein